MNYELLGILGLNVGNCIIDGSSALHIYGNYPKQCNDLDVLTILDPVYFEKRGLTEIKGVLGGRRFVDKFQTVDINCDDKYFREVFPNSQIFNGYRYMGYEDLLNFYNKLYEKKKDEKYLQTYEWLKIQKQ